MANAHDHALTQWEAIGGAASRPWRPAVTFVATATTPAFAGKAMAGIDGYGKDSRTERSLSRIGASSG